MPLPARLTQLQSNAVGFLRRFRPTVNGLPAVRWLSVRQLRRTAADVVLSSIFARFADKREAMAAGPREFHRLSVDSAERRDVWIDFVADTGDGFDATFATACCLAGPPGLAVAAGPGDPEPVAFDGRPAQADLLVLGGDQVYPVASALAYEVRLNEVLRAAAKLADCTSSPPVIALPGNHDWYDGLAAFRRNFCESWVLRGHEYPPPTAPRTTAVPAPRERDDVGGWGAFQSRSYFAVQLSARWWLWGVDSQLNAPIDAEQLAYFHDARRLLGDADVILCTAEPSWLEAGGDRVYAALADTPFYTLLWFIDRVLGPDRERIRLVLTGDQHHYSRYHPGVADPAERPEFAPELVTCGGGGAFLASTHHLPDTLTAAWQPWPTGSGQTVRYDRAAAYPTPQQSRRLTATPRFLAAAWRNGLSLPLLVGAVDYLLALTVLLDQRWPFGTTVAVLGALLGVYAASGARGQRPQWRRRVTIATLLLLHTAAHVGVAWAAVAVVSRLLRWWPPGAHVTGFMLAAVLGTVVFVTYLHLADRGGAHTLEAFSALRFTGFKSHLRIRIDDDRVTVYVIGMDTVPAARHAARLGDRLPRPHLVESFSVPARHSPAAGGVGTAQRAISKERADATCSAVPDVRRDRRAGGERRPAADPRAR
jgi:hypothetical protein